MRAAESGHQAPADIQAANIEQTAAAYAPHGAPEMPDVSVDASSGHGYEFMMKRAWEELQERHLDASAYPEGSDIRTLLEATDKNIDQVVHRIASDNAHGFFNTDGTSVEIAKSGHLAFNADGNLAFGDATHAAAVHAPEGAHLTAPYSAHETAIPEKLEGIAPGDYPAPEAPISIESTPPVAEVVAPTDVPAAPIEHAVATPDTNVLHDGYGGVVTDGSGNPVHTGAYEASTAPVPHTPAIEHNAIPTPEAITANLHEFVNQHQVAIDPLQGHVFQDQGGSALAYGNDYAARLEAAKEFARAHPGTPIWVEAEKPVVIDGAPHPFVFEVKYDGPLSFLRTLQVISPDAPANETLIGAVDPSTFTAQLDK